MQGNLRMARKLQNKNPEYKSEKKIKKRVYILYIKLLEIDEVEMNQSKRFGSNNEFSDKHFFVLYLNLR